MRRRAALLRTHWSKAHREGMRFLLGALVLRDRGKLGGGARPRYSR
jgi:hypothetical protein